jgi:hypothetical protein
VGSYRPIFLVGGKWSVRPLELEKSAAKGEPLTSFFFGPSVNIM